MRRPEPYDFDRGLVYISLYLRSCVYLMISQLKIEILSHVNQLVAFAETVRRESRLLNATCLPAHRYVP